MCCCIVIVCCHVLMISFYVLLATYILDWTYFYFITTVLWPSTTTTGLIYYHSLRLCTTNYSHLQIVLKVCGSEKNCSFIFFTVFNLRHTRLFFFSFFFAFREIDMTFRVNSMCVVLGRVFKRVKSFEISMKALQMMWYTICENFEISEIYQQFERFKKSRRFMF